MRELIPAIPQVPRLSSRARGAPGTRDFARDVRRSC
jgi:hypothetical protein